MIGSVNRNDAALLIYVCARVCVCFVNMITVMRRTSSEDGGYFLSSSGGKTPLVPCRFLSLCNNLTDGYSTSRVVMMDDDYDYDYDYDYYDDDVGGGYILIE